MTVRNQTVIVTLPDGEVQVTLVATINACYPQRPRYDVFLPGGAEAGTVSQVMTTAGCGRGRRANRRATPQMRWQPACPNGSLLLVQRTRAAALRALIVTVGA